MTLNKFIDQGAREVIAGCQSARVSPPDSIEIQALLNPQGEVAQLKDAVISTVNIKVDLRPWIGAPGPDSP